MRKMMLVAAMAALAFGQQAAVAAKPAPKGVITLPAEAKKNGDGTWTHTDAAGKTWIYRQMPFGLTRAEKGVAEEFANRAVTLPPGMTAVEQGDAVKFSRPTPFGPVTWTKKMDELSDTERAVLALSRKRAEAAKTASK